jgi:hypothetical protein
VLRAVPNVVGDVGATALAKALPGSGLRRLDLRHTGVTGRGAHRLLAALERCRTGPAQVPAHDGAGGELEQLGLGSGIPRRIKRAVSGHLRPLSPPAEDVLAVSSVYR